MFYKCNKTPSIKKISRSFSTARGCPKKLKSSNFFDDTLQNWDKKYLSNDVNFSNRRTCTFIPGDGPGIDLAYAVQDIFFAAHVPIGFESILLSDTVPHKSAPFDLAVASILRNRLCLKGVLDNSNQDKQSLNFRLNNKLGLYGRIIQVKSMQFLESKFENIDIVISTEQVHGNYSVVEFEISDKLVGCSKTVHFDTYRKLLEHVLNYAKKNQRKTVKFVHKGNIFKLRDGFFLRACDEVSKRYSNIDCGQIIVDNCTREMVSYPEKFDVIVVPNIYEAILQVLLQVWLEDRNIPHVFRFLMNVPFLNR